MTLISHILNRMGVHVMLAAQVWYTACTRKWRLPTNRNQVEPCLFIIFTRENGRLHMRKKIAIVLLMLSLLLAVQASSAFAGYAIGNGFEAQPMGLEFVGQ